MPGFTPGRRWQPPFYPFKKEEGGRLWLARLERLVKGPMFGCRMCGNCLLQETAFICPMECPKGARNGPCGGSEAGHCEIDPDTPCAWQLIYDRLSSVGKLDVLMNIQPPKNWQTSRDGGPRKIVREDLRLHTGEE